MSVDEIKKTTSAPRVERTETSSSITPHSVEVIKEGVDDVSTAAPQVVATSSKSLEVDVSTGRPYTDYSTIVTDTVGAGEGVIDPTSVTPSRFADCVGDRRCDRNADCVKDKDGRKRCECSAGFEGDGIICAGEGII